MAHIRLHTLVLTLAAAAASGCSESHMQDVDGGERGTDAPSSDSGLPPDACACVDVGSWDAGVPVASCEADDARAVTCPAALCDGPDSYAWDGERCVFIACGACEGADCGTVARSPAECEAAHAGCEPSLCRATGGDWLFFAEECHPYWCGMRVPADCLVGRPICDCGTGRRFDPGLGCVEEPACPAIDPLPPAELCGATGGTWTDGICCSTVCGQFCDDDCALPACVCGALEVFDAAFGCVPALECFEREVGETCGFAGTRCGDGMICCQHCGGAGCSPDMTCEVPLCDADPSIDECGNNLLAP